MGLNASYWIDCDLCGTDAGASRATMDDAWDYVSRGGWWINRSYGAAVCDECYDENMIYHAQFRNVFCVLCQTGDHIAIIK